MTAGSPYRLLHLDLLPLLQEVFDQVAGEVGIDFDRFCNLVYRSMYGPYLRSREWDGLDRGKIEDAAWTVGRWAHSLVRIPQIRDPGIRLLRPYIEVETGAHHCEAVTRLCGRWIGPEELERLPLPNCDYKRCLCTYRTLSRLDIEGLGPRPGAQS